MKRLYYLILALAMGGVSTKAAPLPAWVNYGTIGLPTNISALSFQNFGTFAFTNSELNTNIGTPGASELNLAFIPFTTANTSFFTNTGFITLTPGFEFDDGTSGGRVPAADFNNSGVIIGLDTEGNSLSFANQSGAALPGPQPSQVLIYAKNIINETGKIQTGNDGLLQMAGSNVDLSYGAAAAGTVDQTDPNDTTGPQGFTDENLFFLGLGYLNPPTVYDLFWGSDTGLDPTITADPGNTGTYTVTFQNDAIFGNPYSTRNDGQNIFNNIFNQTTFTSNSFSGLSAFAFSSSVFSNFFFTTINVVLINTNLPDTNLFVNVGFNSLNASNNLFGFFFDDGIENIVQIGELATNVETGLPVTNAVYLLDTGGVFDDYFIDTNAASVNGYGRPDCFLIATAQPPDWPTAQPTNTVVDPTTVEFFTGNDAIYRAQVGRDPEQLDGSFQSFETNFTSVELTDVPDPTNEPARLEISANQLNITNARLLSDGVASFTATNIVGTGSAIDWGSYNTDLNETNGVLNISNLFPRNFRRVRGDITAWCGDSLITNIDPIFGTNVIFAHVLVVMPSLRGIYTNSARNLAFRAKNTINIQDGLRVINNSLFLSSNLDINAEVDLTQNAQSLWPSNTPNLKQLMIGTNGYLAADDVIDVGFNTATGHTGPVKRKYTIASITNLGVMSATASLLESSNFECDGAIAATNSGSIIIEAANLGLGFVLSNASNSLIADGDITLSANFIALTNSTIASGGTNGAGKGLLLLETTAGGEITDFGSGAPATNTYPTNMWQVTDGFSLPVKPSIGDLFDTEIDTIATNFTVALHTWAGLDLGASSDGFSDNMVIGHLKLSRQSETAELHFTGAGTQNGMYVDYLELDTNSDSYSNYTTGLVIDPNLTIYFAACNVDPIKLTTVYSNRLVWVPSFVGPNSSVVIPSGSNGYCFANSSAYERAKLEGTNTTCVSDITTFRDYAVQTGPSNEVYLTIATSGDGSVTPKLKQDQIALGKSYSLSASPAPGWVFSGWSGDGLPAEADVKSSNLRFTLEDNLSVTANFTPKTFTLVKGTYYGLFSETNGTAFPGNAGWFTLTVGASGAASGKLLVGPTTYTFSSKLPTNGFLSVTAVHGHDTIMVDFQFDMNESTGQVTGYVNGETNIQLLGNLAPTWTDKDSSPYAGRYTMILTNTATNSGPSAYSYGTVDVSKTGKVSVAGKLADGNSYSQTVPISMDGLWPFYAYTSSGQDFLLGWIPFEKGGVGSASIGATNVFWSKAAMPKSPYYPDGFTSSFAVVGSPYSFPGKNSTGLSLPNPVLVFSGGGLATSITNTVIGNGKLLVTGTNLSLTINPTTGTFAGKVKDIGAKPNAWMGGVILQNQNSAFGFLLGTNNESDAVLLQNQ